MSLDANWNFFEASKYSKPRSLDWAVAIFVELLDSQVGWVLHFAIMQCTNNKVERSVRLPIVASMSNWAERSYKIQPIPSYPRRTVKAPSTAN
jgi:hypothetical protein